MKGDNRYYNLMGQKVTGNLPAGIYIHNGKKVREVRLLPIT